jgi:hypothetical protein
MKYLRLLLIGSILALAIGGGFAPWVYRPPVALQLTPPGLAEFVKFLHEVRLGQLTLQRLHFLLPLTVAALGLPLIAVNTQLQLAWPINWLLRLSVIPMALSLLSPIWAPERLMNEEFRLQTIVAAGCIGLAGFAFLFSKLPLKWLTTGLTLLTITGLRLADYCRHGWSGCQQWLAVAPARCCSRPASNSDPQSPPNG